MDRSVAYTLLKSLLERLEADSKLGSPRMAGLVSASELTALQAVVEQLGTEIERQESLAMTADEHSEAAASPPGTTSLERKLAGSTESKVDVSAFELSSTQDSEYVLCLDFGTAKSKAFAASKDDNPVFLELALGKRDGDLDGSVYAVSSSVWIDDDGRIFAGSEAVRRGAQRATDGSARRRLDSLKQELSQVLPDHQVSSQLLSKDVNPCGVELTYDDAITFYLAFLTDLAVSELQERHGKSRYVKRRFAIPCWEAGHRIRAARFLSRRLAAAQVLADTFHGRWKDGIPADELKRAAALVLPRVDQLMYLLDQKLDAQGHLSVRWAGLLEPLAAGSSRIWMDRGARDLVMVLDVGAGTTDLSLFWVVQNVKDSGHQAFPVQPCGTAIRMAGDHLDSVLVSLILERAKLGADPMLQKRVGSALFLAGVRRLKETLFNTGELSHRLVNDQVVSITLDEFLAAEGVRNFTDHLEGAIEDFIRGVDETWRGPLANLKLVLTGGGCDLPMVKGLTEKTWLFGGTKIRLQGTKNLPDVVVERFAEDFVKEYPQLAVALGGALPLVLDEGNAQEKWYGGAPPPGPVTKYQVTGM